MISLLLACVLSGPCDGGRCAVVLPRLRVADSVIERHREVKVTREVTAERRVAARPHRIARAVVRVVR